MVQFFAPGIVVHYVHTSPYAYQEPEETVKLILDDITSFSIEVEYEIFYPHREPAFSEQAFLIAIYFKSNEDVNLYKLAGQYKEDELLEFRIE